MRLDVLKNTAFVLIALILGATLLGSYVSESSKTSTEIRTVMGKDEYVKRTHFGRQITYTTYYRLVIGEDEYVIVDKEVQDAVEIGDKISVRKIDHYNLNEYYETTYELNSIKESEDENVTN